MRILVRFFVVLALGSVTLLMGETMSKIASSPAFDKMKTLVGSWEGTVKEGGKQLPTNARFQLVADSSALAGWLAERTPHEMVTMFHMDGDILMATHYCAAHNQPRMVLVSGGDPNRLVFKFKDGTNIQSDAGHMQQVAFTFDTPNHHIEEWTYLEKGKEDTTRFEFRRKQ
jgi:hypothetical protein